MKIKVDAEIELRENPYKGRYIAFEGIDGAGKTTQLEKLVDYLKEQGKDFVVTSEPRKTGSEVGMLIHRILRGEVVMPSASLQYLYTSERIANHEEVIDPSLEKGMTVLSHRSVWSNLPYGMLDQGVSNFDSNNARIIDLAQGLLSLYHRFIIPDITFYLRVSAKTAIGRVNARYIKDHEIYEKVDKLERIAKGYEWQVSKYSELFTVIDGERDEKEVFQDVLKEIGKKFDL